jgi:hypothetical protein
LIVAYRRPPSLRSEFRPFCNAPPFGLWLASALARRNDAIEAVADRGLELVGTPYFGAESHGDGTPTRMSREKSGD